MDKKFKFSKKMIIGIILILLLIVAIFDIAKWFYDTNLNKKKMKELENEILIEGQNEGTDAGYENDEEAKKMISERTSIDFNKLLEINPDTKGWLKIEALGISYPIVQYTDNDYYLKKDIYKEDSISGSIFLDYRNSGFDDKNTIIYGHNMKNDTMFGKLDEILKGKVGTDVDVLILTPDKSYKYKAFSTYEVNPKEFRLSESMETVLGKSQVDFGVDVNLDEKFVSLYTCTDATSKKTILHAYLVREV